MALHLIMFDCDGVILESVDAKTRAFARVAEPYGSEVVERLVRFHMENGGVSRSVKFAWLFKEVLNREPRPGELDVINKKFIALSLDEVLHAQEVPGIRAVLDRWKGRVPMYVASGAPHEELHTVLKEHGLSGYFTGIFGSPPGKTDLLRRILEESGIAAAHSVMIGDSGTDQYAAETVGARFYGRGDYFKYSGYPWHADLTRLNEYLEALANDEE